MRKILSAAEGRDGLREGPHPDLLDAWRAHHCVHTTGGRVLPTWRTAVADYATQQARLADPAGWLHHVQFEPVYNAIAGARSYAAQAGLPDPHQMNYEQIRRTPGSVAAVGHNYDSLPDTDRSALASYEALRREVGHQYNHLTNTMGVNVQSVDHDPYPDVDAMLHDVNTNNRLQVLSTAATGGHPYFSDADNDKFRAVHDYFGHAGTGRSFDRHGEQAAYLAHAQMFSPQAIPALASETKGQNSSLILNGHFPTQKLATMNPVHYSDAMALHPAARVASRRLARPRRPDYAPIGHDYFPTDVISHYTMRKGEGFGDEKAPLYELSNKPPLSQQIAQGGYEKPVELFTDGRSGYIGDGHHRIDVARQLGHTHVPVQVFWRTPYAGNDTVSDNRIEPWLKGWLADMNKGRQTASLRIAFKDTEGYHQT